jgi:4-amino-4-deoxy-L-arabinose transferase-like glycosyltransferase
LVAFVVLLALLLRFQFVHQAQVIQPASGDSRHYVAYAINLAKNHTFSKALPGQPVVPDSFRSPGYPLFLAACIRAANGTANDRWYHLALWLQCVLGAATAWLAIGLGRQWLPSEVALGVGLAVAVWPHHVVASSALLSEVLLGFLLALSLALAALALHRRNLVAASGAGLALGAGVLVNPAMLFLPLFLALPFVRSERRRLLVPLLVLPLLCSGAWAWRDAQLPDAEGTGRGALNFVQGSWPEMHAAWRSGRVEEGEALGAERSVVVAAQIDAEAALLDQQPLDGMRMIGRRFAGSPAYYIRWYLLEKPFLLWDWEIRVGAGDIYVNAIENSPFERNPVLRLLRNALRLANPLLFVLALAGLVSIARRGWREDRDAIAALVALAFVYFTAVHGVFQAEPRYAIAYRAEEMLLAATALAALSSAWRARRATPSAPEPA